MDRSTEGAGNESRLASYLEHLASTLGHADRRAPFYSISSMVYASQNPSQNESIATILRVAISSQPLLKCDIKKRR